MKRGEENWFVCPHCGAEVPAGAHACPECGSDDRTGWAEDADRWAADIPAGYGEDDEFDYDEFIRREFPGQAGRPSAGALVGIGLGVALIVLLVILLATGH